MDARIKKLTKEEAERLLSSNDPGTSGSYRPLGLFIVDEWDGTFTAIDNSDGDAWTEPFCSEERAVEWLLEYV